MPEFWNLALGSVEEIRWTSHDGKEISGLLVRPVGFVEGRRYPLIVDVHGGPNGGVGLDGQLLNGTPLELHYWAGRGYAVLAPDYRSSRVYGWDPSMDFDDKTRHATQFDNDYRDVMSGVDHVIKIGVADPRRLVWIGHSFGSLLANYALTRTTRFATVVTKDGYWLDPWESGLADIRTPTLAVTAGKGATRKRLGEMIERIRAAGIEGEHINYADDGHVLRKRENQEDVLRRVTAWVDRFARPAGDVPEPKSTKSK